MNSPPSLSTLRKLAKISQTKMEPAEDVSAEQNFRPNDFLGKKNWLSFFSALSLRLGSSEITRAEIKVGCNDLFVVNSRILEAILEMEILTKISWHYILEKNSLDLDCSTPFVFV